MGVKPEDSIPTTHVASFVRSNLIAWGIISGAVSVLPAAGVSHAAPLFESMFQGFGADVPRSTLLLLHWPHVLWIIPVVWAAVFILALKRASSALVAHGRTVILLGTIAGIAVVAGSLATLALYAPIFRLAAPI